MKANKLTKREVLERDVSLMWAFGSNLNMRAMQERCPKAEPLEPLYLPNGLLVFRGVADVEGKTDERKIVAGGLWKVTPECIRALDRYEGVSSGLYSKKYLVIKIRGEIKAVLFYKMENERGIMPPWDAYFDVIAEGYRDFGLDERFLLDARARSWAEKRKTPHLNQRWERKGKPRLSRG